MAQKATVSEALASRGAFHTHVSRSWSVVFPLQLTASPKAWNSTGQCFKGSFIKEVTIWLWEISSAISHLNVPVRKMYDSWGHGELALEEASLAMFLAKILLHNWFLTLNSLLFHLGTWDLSRHTKIRVSLVVGKSQLCQGSWLLRLNSSFRRQMWSSTLHPCTLALKRFSSLLTPDIPQGNAAFKT